MLHLREQLQTVIPQSVFLVIADIGNSKQIHNLKLRNLEQAV